MKVRRRHFGFYMAWTRALIPALVLVLTTFDSEAASSGTLAFRTVDVDAATGEPSGVRATVMARSPALAEAPFATVDDTGTYKAGPFHCTDGMNFKAVPKSTMVYVSTDDWKPCGYEEIVFSFSRNAYALNVKVILDLDYNKFSTTDPFVTALGSKLVAAASSNTLGDVPALSTELMKEFERIGRNDLASAAKVVAYESTNLVLGVKEPLRFDSVQDEFVLPQETVAAIKGFQSQEGIKRSGKIDWKTMDVMSTNYGTGITAEWGKQF